MQPLLDFCDVDDQDIYSMLSILLILILLTATLILPLHGVPL